jgi:hypothetical protein
VAFVFRQGRHLRRYLTVERARVEAALIWPMPAASGGSAALWSFTIARLQKALSELSRKKTLLALPSTKPHASPGIDE